MRNLESEIVSLYEGDYSIREISKIYSMHHSVVRGILVKFGKTILGQIDVLRTPRQRERMRSKLSGSNGPRFGMPVSEETREKIRRSRTMECPTSRGPYQERARKTWALYNGPIPHGMLVHHVDRNYKNNDISNLSVVTRAEHNRIHKSKTS